MAVLLRAAEGGHLPVVAHEKQEGRSRVGSRGTVVLAQNVVLDGSCGGADVGVTGVNHVHDVAESLFPVDKEFEVVVVAEHRVGDDEVADGGGVELLAGAGHRVGHRIGGVLEHRAAVSGLQLVGGGQVGVHIGNLNVH